MFPTNVNLNFPTHEQILCNYSEMTGGRSTAHAGVAGELCLKAVGLRGLVPCHIAYLYERLPAKKTWRWDRGPVPLSHTSE